MILNFFRKEEKTNIYDNFINEPLTENSEDPMEQELEDVDKNTNLVTRLFNTEKLTRFYNKLHLLRSDFKYICLDGEDGSKCLKFVL